jgi:hypothetical protein
MAVVLPSAYTAVTWQWVYMSQYEILQLPARAGSSLADFSTLEMEAIRSSETSVQSTTSTRRHTPEDGILKILWSLLIIQTQCKK